MEFRTTSENPQFRSEFSSLNDEDAAVQSTIDQAVEEFQKDPELKQYYSDQEALKAAVKTFLYRDNEGYVWLDVQPQALHQTYSRFHSSHAKIDRNVGDHVVLGHQGIESALAGATNFQILFQVLERELKDIESEVKQYTDDKIFLAFIGGLVGALGMTGVQVWGDEPLKMLMKEKFQFFSDRYVENKVWEDIKNDPVALECLGQKEAESGLAIIPEFGLKIPKLNDPRIAKLVGKASILLAGALGAMSVLHLDIFDEAPSGETSQTLPPDESFEPDIDLDADFSGLENLEIPRPSLIDMMIEVAQADSYEETNEKRLDLRNYQVKTWGEMREKILEGKVDEANQVYQGYLGYVQSYCTTHALDPAEFHSEKLSKMMVELEGQMALNLWVKRKDVKPIAVMATGLSVLAISNLSNSEWAMDFFNDFFRGKGKKVRHAQMMSELDHDAKVFKARFLSQFSQCAEHPDVKYYDVREALKFDESYNPQAYFSPELIRTQADLQSQIYAEGTFSISSESTHIPGILPNSAIPAITIPTLQVRPAIQTPRLIYSRAPILESAMSMSAANAGSYSLAWQQPLRMAAGAEFMSGASGAQFYAAPEPATARPVFRVVDGGRSATRVDVGMGGPANSANYTTETATPKQTSPGRSAVAGLLLYEGGYVLINGVMYAVGVDGKIVDTTNKIYGAAGMTLGANYLLKNPAMIGPALAMIPGMQLGGNVARGEMEDSIRVQQWSPLVEELAVLGTQAGGTLVGAGTSAAAVESLAVASGMSRFAAGTGVGLVLLAINGIYMQFKRNRDLQKAEDGFRNNGTLRKEAPEILQRFDEIKADFDTNPFDAVTFYALDAADTDQILQNYDARLDKLEKYFQDPDPVTKAVMSLMGYWFEEKYFSRWDDLSSDLKMMSRYGDGFAVDLRDTLVQRYGPRISLMRAVLRDPYLEDRHDKQIEHALKRADPQKISKYEQDLKQLVEDGALRQEQAQQEMAGALLKGKLSKDPVVAPKTFVIPDSLDFDALYNTANADYEIMTRGWYTRKGYPNATFMENIRHELRMKVVSYKKDEGLSPEACAVKTTRFLESVLRDLQKLMDHKGDDLDFNSAVIMQGSLDNMTALLQDYRNTADPVYISTTLSEKKSILSHLNDFTVAYLSRG